SKRKIHMKRARMLKSLMKNQGLQSAGLLVLILAAAVMLMGQSLPKKPVWDKGAFPAAETKQSKGPAASGGVKSGSAGIEVRTAKGVSNHKTIQAALAAAGSSQATLHLSPGNWVIPENLDFPKNITLAFERGAILSVGTGVKVTINSEIEAGFQQIFSGPGGVEGNIRARFIYPQWWGAQGDGVTDDYEAIAHAAHAARGKVLFLRHGTYLTSQMIVLPEQIFVDADPGTIIKASKSMQAVMTTGVAMKPNYGAQQFSVRNVRIDGNKLADNCIYLYKISMNNFDALDGVSTHKAVSDGIVLVACQGGSFKNIQTFDNGGNGIAILGCNSASFHSISATANKKSGVYISRFSDKDGAHYGGGCTVTRMHCESNAEHGLDIFKVVNNNRVSIVGGWIEMNGGDGVRITSSPVTISGSLFFGVGTGSNYAVHIMSGSQVCVTGCTLVGAKGSAYVFKDEGNNPDNVFYFNYDGIKGCYNKKAMFDSVLPDKAGRQTIK
ncbi:MAG: right-handed parallel beta-helix repeat-containing protein, partial [Deltaproteobacteria bacterium]|nr:right-handed parallel beta-helix repeat-containing protein [Deltaproteobacteria bacterium]